ncbi:uncharacterized protein PHALS_00495 [Plasmopara halstedii]|uniref:Uncharacterized protein n=1 Tax=Plasmopara halstedii TaxID=4781 RepID=A0A0N7L3L0_PLAHL|nr:uncharacterized protein PHALS_00495 [Plasmopara halstedii]CEG36171.1 hypothetical protein PHALS_00495 [Plasmopara halstedii]|eukprot:XP_024572540.1 hypothetical protein PHALS_00495 [Plasmopara halstedii]
MHFERVLTEIITIVLLRGPNSISPTERNIMDVQADSESSSPEPVEKDDCFDTAKYAQCVMRPLSKPA